MVQPELEIFETGTINDANSGCPNGTDGSSLRTTIFCTIPERFPEKSRPVWSRSARTAPYEGRRRARRSNKFSSNAILSFL